MDNVKQAAHDAPADKGSFGAWLLRQDERGGSLGELAKCAKADRGFPKHGGPEEVRKRMGAVAADGDMWEALDDAELDWSSY